MEIVCIDQYYIDNLINKYAEKKIYAYSEENFNFAFPDQAQRKQVRERLQVIKSPETSEEMMAPGREREKERGKERREEPMR